MAPLFKSEIEVETRWSREPMDVLIRAVLVAWATRSSCGGWPPIRRSSGWKATSCHLLLEAMGATTSMDQPWKPQGPLEAENGC